MQNCPAAVIQRHYHTWTDLLWANTNRYLVHVYWLIFSQYRTGRRPDWWCLRSAPLHGHWTTFPRLLHPASSSILLVSTSHDQSVHGERWSVSSYRAPSPACARWTTWRCAALICEAFRRQFASNFSAPLWPLSSAAVVESMSSVDPGVSCPAAGRDGLSGSTRQRLNDDRLRLIDVGVARRPVAGRPPAHPLACPRFYLRQSSLHRNNDDVVDDVTARCDDGGNEKDKARKTNFGIVTISDVISHLYRRCSRHTEHRSPWNRKPNTAAINDSAVN